jgi:MYXO-CTERM domain-containing protein
MTATLLTLAAVAALAAPQRFELAQPVPWELDPDQADALLERAAGMSGPEATAVEVLAPGPDGILRPLEDYLPAVPPVPIKAGEESPPPPIAHPADHPGAGSGVLSGKAVYISQCHGWIWYDSLGRFSTQRPNVYDTVEDFHNPEASNWYLAAMLENAGAAVFTVKDRGMNSASVVIDNDAPGSGGRYTESGAGFQDGAAGWAAADRWTYGEDPFDAGGTRRFPADGGDSVSWVPDVPEDGWYTVYVAWDSDSGNAQDAHYRITHPGGVIDRWFDQTVHGSTWQYLETLWLPAGTEGLEVQLLADSSQSGRWLSADALRVGGGMGDVSRHGEITGRPRFEEGAILHAQYNGAPTSVYDPYSDGDGSDPSARSRWAAWEHPSGEDAVFLSWHSNAAGSPDQARGTSTYTYEGDYGLGVDGSVELAQAVNDELVNAFDALWESGWTDRGTRTAAFGELNPNNNGEMPAALVELAFHDHYADAEYLKHPRFRHDASRALARGIIRYFAERDGQSPSFPPEAPQDLAVVHGDDGRLILSWSSGPAGDPYGDAATGFVVYSSTDGRSWDNGTPVDASPHILDTRPGERIYLRVAATNGAGASLPSEVLGARRSPDGWAPVLVVHAFDRLEVSNLVWEDVGSSLGEVVRMDLLRINAFDTVVAHGQAVADAGWYFDSISDERLADMPLQDYLLVIWAAGEESTADESFTRAQQDRLRSYVEGGGALWASGSEILWDLDYRGDADDQAFASEVLGASMAADDAGTWEADGEGPLAGLSLDFGEQHGAPYPAEYPDVLDGSGERLASYPGVGDAALLSGGVALFGFPFECIGDEVTRAEVASRLLPILAPDYEEPPEPEDTDAPVDSDDPSDTDEPGGFPGGKARDRWAPAGCGCSGGPGAAAWLVVLLPLLAWLPQRRRRTLP